MTYNVEVKDDEGDPWDARTPQTAVNTILSTDSDVVGLQEDASEWNSYLSALTSYGYSRYKTGGNGSESLDIFYKTDRFELLSSGLKFYKKLAEAYPSVPANGADMTKDKQGDKDGLFGLTGEHKGRMFSYVILKDKATGAEILVVNTHLHYGSTESSATEHHLLREYQARLLRTWLDEMVGEYPNQIVMGDLNADYVSSSRGATAINELTANGGLALARETANNRTDIGGTLASSSNYVDRDKYVFDHILYRNVTAEYYSVVNNKVDEVDGVMRYPSDHLPVVAVFKCSAE